MVVESAPDVAHSIAQVDMINATSKLQIEAAEVRNSSNKPNWSSYLRSELIPQEEYNFIIAYEAAKTKAERDEVLSRDPNNTAKCIIGLITDVAKDVLIRYVLTLLDDMLQVRLALFSALRGWSKSLGGSFTRRDISCICA